MMAEFGDPGMWHVAGTRFLCDRRSGQSPRESHPPLCHMSLLSTDRELAAVAAKKSSLSGRRDPGPPETPAIEYSTFMVARGREFLGRPL